MATTRLPVPSFRSSSGTVAHLAAAATRSRTVASRRAAHGRGSLRGIPHPFHAGCVPPFPARRPTTLGNNNDKVALARLLRAAHALNHIAFKIERHFGDQDRRCAAGDTGIERNIPRFSAHDLHDRAAVMRFGRITQAVNHFHDRVHGCIITDRIVAAGDIVIDRAGDADTGYTAQRKVACTTERTVTADDDDPLHINLFADIDGFLHTLFGFEFGAARRIQDRAAGD